MVPAFPVLLQLNIPNLCYDPSGGEGCYGAEREVARVARGRTENTAGQAQRLVARGTHPSALSSDRGGAAGSLDHGSGRTRRLSLHHRLRLAPSIQPQRVCQLRAGRQPQGATADSARHTTARTGGRGAVESRAERGLPFSVWSVPKLAEYCRNRKLLPAVSDEWVRRLLRREGLTAQRVRTWKTSSDPDFDRKRPRFAGSIASAPRGRR